jgi:hypothetical protein
MGVRVVNTAPTRCSVAAVGMLPRTVTACLASATLLATARDARAYRPFDGTDADVAEEGTFELELGPIGYLHHAPNDALVAPTVVLNQGIDDDVELIVQTNRLHLLGSLAGVRRDQYVDTAFLMKHVWRDGGLQDESGPSIATEIGTLFPTGPDDHHVGAIATTIVSLVTDPATFHFNLAPSLTVRHDADLFASTIVEGPHAWSLRPVTELAFERDFGDGNIYSLLGGARYVVQEGLELDAGVRVASVAGESLVEGRVGVTWALQLWSDREPRIEGPKTGH